MAGFKLVRVGTIEDTPLDALIVLGEEPIKSLADLEGRRIGMSAGAAHQVLLHAMLATVGLKPSDIALSEVNTQYEAALMSHRVDALLGGMRNYELILLLARQDDAHDPPIRHSLATLQEGTNTLLNHLDEM